jgi:hypothetical protein
MGFSIKPRLLNWFANISGILRSWGGIVNAPEKLDELFAIHQYEELRGNPLVALTFSAFFTI